MPDDIPPIIANCPKCGAILWSDGPYSQIVQFACLSWVMKTTGDMGHQTADCKLARANKRIAELERENEKLRKAVEH